MNQDMSGNQPPAAPQPLPPPLSPPVPLSDADARTWAMLAHLSVLLNLVTGFFGPVGALIIYFVFKDRSRYVAYQALQSLIFQLVWWVGGGFLTVALFALGGFLSFILIGLLCFPLALLTGLMPIVAVIYGIVAGIQCYQGQDFRYWLVGDWVRGTLTI